MTPKCLVCRVAFRGIDGKTCGDPVCVAEYGRRQRLRPRRRFTKGEAIAAGHTHRCTDCGHTRRIRNRSCPNGFSGVTCHEVCGMCKAKFAGVQL